MSRGNALLAVTRLAAEADRITRIKELSTRPENCGDAIVEMAPARGPVQRFQPCETVITAAGQVRVRRVGHNGQDALRRADAFDVMQLRSRARKPDGPPLFTAAQIGIGRDYAALYERCAAAGVRCSSVEALGHGGSGQGSFIDALIRDRRRLAAMERAIGSDVVLEPRGALAHRERGRQGLRVCDVVRGVCISGQTISQLLQSFGWSRAPAFTKETMAALCAALDRMRSASEFS